MHLHPPIIDGGGEHRPGEGGFGLGQRASGQCASCSVDSAAGAAAPGFWMTASTSRRSPLASRKVSVTLPRPIAVSLTPQSIRCLPTGAKATLELDRKNTRLKSS